MINNKSNLTNHNRRILFVILVILAIMLNACDSDDGTITTNEEESSTELTLDGSYDKVRNGARLSLTYDAQSNSFIGFVENTTDNILKQVRVEVHLSNGTELGPTTPTDLSPGESIDITLAATSEGFDGWTAHPEVGESGGSEHGEEGESGHNEGDSD